MDDEQFSGEEAEIFKDLEASNVNVLTTKEDPKDFEDFHIDLADGETENTRKRKQDPQNQRLHKRPQESVTNNSGLKAGLKVLAEKEKETRQRLNIFDIDESPVNEKFTLRGTYQEIDVAMESIFNEDFENDNPKGEGVPGLATNSIFLFPFCEKSLIWLEGKSMTPDRGNTILFCSSQQLPRLRLVCCFRNYNDTSTPSGVLYSVNNS